MKRCSGILMHISSLPSAYGIGTMGQEAYAFVDFLKASGTTVWQMLPIGETGYGDSPFQSVSTFAGNPYFIDLDMLVADGVLAASDIAHLSGVPYEDRVDFAFLRRTRLEVLRTAFGRSYQKLKNDVDEFARHAPWLFDYALFCALKSHFHGKAWNEWPDDAIRLRRREAVERYAVQLRQDIAFYSFVQYLFNKQWFALKSYANRNGVRIFGDMPIYVAMDSADTWAHTELFELDENKKPKSVAGVPPDYFSQNGQLWGNPVYDWRAHRKTGFEWWRQRMAAMAGYFDMLRIDHFIGFACYYAVPADAPTARYGEWRKGPGRALFRAVRRETAALTVVAEDLGAVTPGVKRLLKWCGYPGMRVLQFAFGSDDKNPHLPHHIPCNSVVYTGTHDNDTLSGWWEKAEDSERRFAMRYLDTDEAHIVGALIEAAYNSAANIAVVPMQDHLRLQTGARMNTPGTVGGNWQWRMRPGQLSDDLKNEILSLNLKSHRTGDA